MNKNSTQTRWTKIADKLRKAIETGELLSGSRLPSETEIAVQWGVSPVTAHRAMQELQREGLIIRKRKAGTVVAERPVVVEDSSHVALILGHWGDRLFSSYGTGIRDALPTNINLIPYDSRFTVRHEKACLEQVEADSKTDAVVICPTCAPENMPLLIQVARKFPVVLVDHIPVGFENLNVLWDGVMTDNFGSMRAGVQLLHRHGHKRIAYFMGDISAISSARERYEAYRQFMNENGKSDVSQWVREIPTDLSHNDYFEQIEVYLRQLLSGPEPITAICCQQDQTMAAVLEACIHLRVSIPEQLEIFSFSDSDPTTIPLSRSVHRCEQRAYEMGSMAARRLLMRMVNPLLPSQIMQLLADIHPASFTTSRPLFESAIEPKLPLKKATKRALASSQPYG